MKAQIVLGLGFGDEGKGTSVSFLCHKAISNNEKTIVVRFNGGHQAGHTVIHENKKHIFSSFGSGSLQGVPTYLSNYCTFFPTAVCNEYDSLMSKKIAPILFVDPLCPVTTPYDVQENINREKVNNHGSVGVGFGSTIKRQESYYKLFVQDLFFPKVLNAKLENISNFYGFKLDLTEFLEDIEKSKNIIAVSNRTMLNEFNTLIFEGAQGILLDQDFGFFPNVTRSNTTSKNAYEILESLNTEHTQYSFSRSFNISLYFVTRTYQTRHGNGFMTNETDDLKLVNNEDETNVLNPNQGKFRIGKLDEELINYAIRCDENCYNSYYDDINLIITCNDQYHLDIKSFLSKIDTKFDNVFTSYSNCGTKIKKYETLLSKI